MIETPGERTQRGVSDLLAHLPENELESDEIGLGIADDGELLAIRTPAFVYRRLDAGGVVRYFNDGENETWTIFRDRRTVAEGHGPLPAAPELN